MIKSRPTKFRDLTAKDKGYLRITGNSASATVQLIVGDQFSPREIIQFSGTHRSTFYRRKDRLDSGYDVGRSGNVALLTKTEEKSIIEWIIRRRESGINTSYSEIYLRVCFLRKIFFQS